MCNQAGQVILQPVSSSVPAASTPLTSVVTLNRSSGSLPFDCALPTNRFGEKMWFFFLRAEKETAEESAVGHQRHFRRQFEALHGLRHLYRFERLRLVGGERAGVDSGKAKPCTRGRHMTAASLANVSDELIDVGNVRLLPVSLEHPGSDPRLRRQAEQ